MDKKLKALFDFQSFEQEPELQKVIDSVHARYSSARLSLDELDLVAAAGLPQAAPEKKKPGKGK